MLSSPLMVGKPGAVLLTRYAVHGASARGVFGLRSRLHPSKTGQTHVVALGTGADEAFYVVQDAAAQEVYACTSAASSIKSR